MTFVRIFLKKKLAQCSKYAAPLLLVLMALVVVMLGVNAFSFSKNIESSRQTTSDNRVWTTSQLEVDYKSMLLDLAAAESNRSSAAKVRLGASFDIFYSRVEIISSVFKTREVPPSLRENLTLMVSKRNALAVQFDNLDKADPAQFAQLAADARSLEPLLREISLKALDYFVDANSKNRERDSMLWRRFLVISVVLIGLMAAAMSFALLLRRQFARQVEMHQVASKRIQMVYDASMMAVVVSDTQGKIVLFNAASEKIIGASAAQMLGRNVEDTLIPPHRMHAFSRARYLVQAGAAKVLYSGRTIMSSMLDANRREFPIELTMQVSHEADGKTLLIAFFRDMSKEVAHEAALLEARDEARRLAESRTMFLATMSHEMRTPLHGLLASLDLIGESGESAEVSKLLTTARSCAMRSVAQINDVLDLVQLDQSQESSTKFSPVKAVSDIVAELTAVAHERNNATQIRLSGSTEGQHWIGAKRTFSAVLYNLIGNALKFTTNGSVSIDLAFRHDHKNGHWLSVAVADTGGGISAADQAHIFDMFFTASGSGIPRQQYGTGLGLPIARKGVENMGGQLCLESTLGKGSRFYFEIPITASGAANSEAESRLVTKQFHQFNLSCLVVDDNIVNLELTEQMLRQLGCKVLACDNGADAVSAAMEVEYDIIFMDLNMPGGMSGIEASRQIRNFEKINRRRGVSSWIVAVTADTTFGSSLNLGEESIDSVLHKPFRMSDLVPLLASFESRKKETLKTTPPAPGDADFAELYDLMGPVAAKRLLSGVVNDLRSLQNTLSNGGDSAFEDLVHRAAGSSGMVGLSSISAVMSEALRKYRLNGYQETEMATVFMACDDAIERIQRFAA